MALFIPDISHHQGDINIQALKDQGAAALIARVGQGQGRRTNGQIYGTTQDRKWVRNRDEARRVGLPLVAYWYVGNLIAADENARLAEAWVGDKSIPWMIDHEDASGNVAFYHQVLAAFARRGLRVVLGYMPKWYWEGGGGKGSLTPGPPLVNSRYPSTVGGPPAAVYSRVGGDTHAAWTGFGGQPVALWQFTNMASMAGMAIDCSAFRGTREQLAAVLGGQTQEDELSWKDTWTFTAPDGTQVTESFDDILGNIYQMLFYGSTSEPWAGPSVVAHLKALAARQVADVDEDALAAAMAAQGIGGGATPAQVKAALQEVFALAATNDTNASAGGN
jgi:GH25 family lysozyme M1 (1,4-beta-N-acetylmuramidase)